MVQDPLSILDALMVALSGFIIVFIMLAVLWGVIVVISRAVTGGEPNRCSSGNRTHACSRTSANCSSSPGSPGGSTVFICSAGSAAGCVGGDQRYRSGLRYGHRQPRDRYSA